MFDPIGNDARITRDELIEFVDLAIHNTNLSEDAQIKLREVARTTDRVARGRFEALDGCGCPIIQAGLYEPHLRLSDPRFRFAHSFDAITLFAGYRVRILEVEK